MTINNSYDMIIADKVEGQYRLLKKKMFIVDKVVESATSQKESLFFFI
ncbi:protein of unknown function (plasmid) [Listeria monocytogenes R479a]|uniref:Uncharacterized protein n=1 Tax=Listeria monocytogenes TaxID=1639 RepID=A0A142ECB3_LISMN|nr:hypothetical protein pA144_0056 [Listeria monocytogenes]CDM15189.1 protein of unknown function [Listeria monocytogenes R479a]CUL76556.1 hypothetical protein LM801457_50058 [Listeria monocytogenes]